MRAIQLDSSERETMYCIHAASIEESGLRLSAEPRAQAETLADALALAADPANHGPEGAAIVCPDGGTIYTSEEYDRAKRANPSRESRDDS